VWIYKNQTGYPTGWLHFGQRAANLPIRPCHPQLGQTNSMLCFMGSDRLKNSFLYNFKTIKTATTAPNP
jgi:hypothetical protein